MNKSNYHHGRLRQALLNSAELLLRNQGIAGLTLRACAKKSGVSHTAPLHYFKDLSGLLTAVVIQGFEKLADAQRDVDNGPAKKRQNLVKAHLQFGMANPGLYDLMFRDPRINRQDPKLLAVIQSAIKPISNTIDNSLPIKQREVEWIQLWPLIHGFVSLASNKTMTDTQGNQISQSGILTMVDTIFMCDGQT